MSRKTKSRLFVGAMVVCLAISFGTLGWLLATTFIDGIPALTKQLFTDPPSTLPEEAGARPGDPRHHLPRGAAPPDGGPDRRPDRDLPRGVRAQGAVVQPPARAQHPEPRRRACDRLRHPRARVRRPRPGGRRTSSSLGGIILTLVVLPTVIIASREAIRAVPPSIREGGFALGATKWQVVSRQVLPASIPGIATGSILALSRAVGETAPLLLIGASSTSRSTRPCSAPSPRCPSRSTPGSSCPTPSSRPCRGGDHRAARDRADDERDRDLPPKPLPTDMVIIG